MQKPTVHDSFYRPPSPRSLPKNTILTEAGRPPWYRADGRPLEAYVIGVAGGSASGKTRVAQAVLKRLGIPWAVVVPQDMFYKSLDEEAHHRAFANQYDFDSPDAFDYAELRTCLEDLKACRSAQTPMYSFVHHQRTDETTYLYGANIVIIEGLFALHDEKIRNLLDLKVFVQCDSDLMLARRLRRDLLERGRDAEGILDQYLRFVKPSFDSFIQPTAKHADIIIPGFNNERALDMIVSHIRRQIDERKQELRTSLYKEVILSDSGGDTSSIVSGDTATGGALPDTVVVMEQTRQLVGIHTVLRDRSTSSDDFIFMANRISTLIVEYALSLLPSRDIEITTGTPLPYTGQTLDVETGHLCGVSILRSGASLERGLRRVIRDAAIGSVLVQSDIKTGEPLLYHVSLPACLTSSPLDAARSWVLLLDSQIGTGAAALMGVRVLLDHGVQEDRIIFCCVLASRIGGVWALKRAFPKVRVVTSAVDNGLEERWTWPHDPTARSYEEALRNKPSSTNIANPKKVFTILPGLGDFGSRYWGS